MPNIDDKGNKIAQKKEKKNVVSKNLRLQAGQRAKLYQDTGIKAGKRCIGCGYRSRGSNHNNGDHHLSWWTSLSKPEKENNPELSPTKE